MIALVQQKLKLSEIGDDPQNRAEDDTKCCPHKRAVIVRFRSEAVRDEVFRPRIYLKEHNIIRTDRQVFLNENLTAKLAKIAFLTRQIKREKGRGLLDACGLHPHNKNTVNKVLTEKDLVL